MKKTYEKSSRQKNDYEKTFDPSPGIGQKRVSFQLFLHFLPSENDETALFPTQIFPVIQSKLRRTLEQKREQKYTEKHRKFPRGKRAQTQSPL